MTPWLRKKVPLLLAAVLFFTTMIGTLNTIEAYGGQCPNVPSDNGVYYPYGSDPWWMQVCHQPSEDQSYPLYPAQSTNIPPEGTRVKKGEVVVFGSNGWATSDDGQHFGSSCWVRLPADATAWDTIGESITNPPSWRISYWSYCQNRVASNPPASQPPYYAPPSSSPTSGLWTYNGDGYNAGGGWLTFTAGANTLVAVTTGKASYRNQWYADDSDPTRGTIFVFVGGMTESVYLPYGGWVGTFTSTNPLNAWDSVRNQKIWDMHHYGNCGNYTNGCRWLDQIVVAPGGGTNYLFGPVKKTGPSY